MLAAACLCHGIVLIYTMVGALIIVACKAGSYLWKVFTRVVTEPTDQERQRIVYALLMAPAAIAVTVLLAQAVPEFYVLTVLAALTLVASAIYSLRLVQRAFFGEAAERLRVADFDRAETALLGLLVAAIVWLGLSPQPLFNMSEPAVTRMLDDGRAGKGGPP